MAESSSMDPSMSIDDENFGSQKTQEPMVVDPSNSVNDDDGMDIDHPNNRDIVESGSILRKKSLLLATFPWFSGIIMTPNKLCEELGHDHYGYVRLSFFLFFFVYRSLFLTILELYS